MVRETLLQHRDLTIATIFSFAPNEPDAADGILDDESFDTEDLDQSFASSRSRKQTILPKVFTEFRIRFVLENACIRPCIFRFLSTQSVLSVVASKPGILDDESFDTEDLDQSSRDFLEMAIDEYNRTFKTNFDTSSKGASNSATRSS